MQQQDERAVAVIAQLDTVLDELQALDLATLTGETTLEVLRGVERSTRRLASVDQAAVAQVERAGLPFEHGCTSTVVFLRHLLGIHPSEAGARVKAARRFGPRRALTGDRLAPEFAAVSAAVASGEISVRHAGLIAETIEHLPDHIDTSLDEIEHDLVEHARTLDPKQLGTVAERVTACLDPDGKLRDHAYRARVRGIHGSRRADGSGRFEIEATAELAELLDTTFDALAAPKPAQDGTPDPRTAAQRRHDALAEALRRVVGSGSLPDTGGMRTSVVLTMDVNDFAADTGMATTSHGYAIPVKLAKTWLEPEARAILVLLSKTKGIEAYSSTHRLFTEQQRLALWARDRGCSFPGCDAPAAWSQAHHIPEFQHSKRTRVDEGAVVCGANHRSFEAMGWHDTIINGRPYWIPPTWIDKNQQPIRNTLHDILPTRPR